MREVLEFISRGSAGVLEEVGDYYWLRVLNRFQMYVHKNDQSVTPCLVQDGFWESWITEYVKDNVDNNTTFYDIGANTGYYSFLAYDLGARVFAYEPNPVYFDMMIETLRRNEGGSNIWVSKAAVSNEHGTANLYVPKDLHGSASMHDLDPKWGTVPVEVKTIALQVKQDGHCFVKVDAEGHEEKIWDGMSESLESREGPTEILLEYTPGAYSPEFIDKLESFAPMHWINGDAQREPVDRAWLESQTDWVMLSLKRD